MKTLKVLMISYVFPPDYFSGSAIQSSRLGGVLQKKGVSLQFLTDNGGKPAVSDEFKGLKVHRFHTTANLLSKWREFLYVAQMIGYIFAHPQHQIYHFHSIRGFEFVVFPLLRMLGKKSILKLTLLGSDDPMAFKSRKKIGFLYFWGLTFVDRFVAISTGLKEKAVESGISPEKVQIVYNGVDTSLYSIPSEERKNELKKKLGFNNEGPIFLSIGRVEHRKGYDLLVAAWKRVSGHFKDACLIIAGPGNEASNSFYKELLQTAESAGLRNVFFTGHIDNAQEYLQITDCFLFCSRAEGFGTVLIEAVAAGVPVVAMNIPGVTEDIIRDDRMGKICYSGKPEEFAGMAIDVVEAKDPKARAEASDHIRREFDIHAIADTYIQLYEQLLDGKK